MHQYSKLGIDEDEIKKIKNNLFLANKTSKTYVSDFLSPASQAIIPELLSEYRELQYELVGGYDEAEYQMLVVGRYLEKEFPFKVLSIKYNEKYNHMTHRDVLGSILSLGIKRNKIGDILLSEGLIEVIVSTDIAEYLLFHLEKIKRAKVRVSLHDCLSIEKKEEVKELYLTVSSLRLDAVIASSYNISRKKAKDDILSGLVKVNHLINTNANYMVKENDLISIRKKGRIRLHNIVGLSKKNKYKIEVYKYL